jgi:hypothetical protein
MELNTSWEAAGRSATQEYPNYLWNPKVFLPCSQDPSIGLYSKQDPYRTTVAKIHFNIILPSTSKSS